MREVVIGLLAAIADYGQYKVSIIIESETKCPLVREWAMTLAVV